jgi:hypothetical protein
MSDGSTPVPTRPTDPGGAVEDAVASAWCTVLGVDTADPDSDFFDAGGQSLGATRMLGMLERGCGVAVPLRIFLRDPTPAGLAAAIDRARRLAESDAGELPPRPPGAPVG